MIQRRVTEHCMDQSLVDVILDKEKHVPSVLKLVSLIATRHFNNI